MVGNLGHRIREARKNAGMKQADLAKKIGVSTSSVGQYEIGTSKPSLEMLVKISDACYVDTDWLLKGIDNTSIENKNKEENDFGHEIENKMLRTLVEELKKDKEYLQNLLTNVTSGKDKVIDLKAGMPLKKKVAIANSAGMVSASMTRQPIMLQ